MGDVWAWMVSDHGVCLAMVGVWPWANSRPDSLLASIFAAPKWMILGSLGREWGRGLGHLAHVALCLQCARKKNIIIISPWRNHKYTVSKHRERKEGKIISLLFFPQSVNLL